MTNLTAIKIVRNIIIALALVVVVSGIILFASCCKSKDIVTVTEDGWRMHSNVPIDTFGLDVDSSLQ